MFSSRHRLQQFSSRILIWLYSSFCESKKIVKSSAKSNELLFVSPNFGFPLSPQLLFASNGSKSFINKLENIVLDMSPCLSPIFCKVVLFLYIMKYFAPYKLRGLYLIMLQESQSYLNHKEIPKVLGFSFKRQSMIYISGQNICSNVKKSSKIRQEEKTLISTFTQFLTAITKVLFLGRRLDTRLCIHPFFRFFKYFQISEVLSCLEIREETSIQCFLYQISCIALLLANGTFGKISKSFIISCHRLQLFFYQLLG